MDYTNKKVAITGVGNGFIADALYERLERAGAEVIDLAGDIRDPKTFEPLNYKIDYLFHFGAPSSQVLFKRKMTYCIDSTVNGFINAVNACKKHGIKLIYPSTGVLSFDVVNEYAACKKICEDIASHENIDSIGLRIFASYGPGERHKRDFASVIHLFAKDIINNRQPIIYGDGSQVRDFIFIDDVIEAIVHIAEESAERIVDIGSGKQTSFNDVIGTINDILKKDIKPRYVHKPTAYVEQTKADVEEMHRFYKPTTTVYSGIKQLLESLQK